MYETAGSIAAQIDVEIISGKFIPNALEVSSAIKLDAIKALANSSVQLLDKKDADAVPDEK